MRTSLSLSSGFSMLAFTLKPAGLLFFERESLAGMIVREEVEREIAADHFYRKVIFTWQVSDDPLLTIDELHSQDLAYEK